MSLVVFSVTYLEKKLVVAFAKGKEDKWLTSTYPALRLVAWNGSAGSKTRN